jgi:hypothetical protein
MTLLTISLTKDRIFQIEATADISKKTVMFTGLANGLPFVQHGDYEVVREIVMETVKMNRNNKEKAN